MSTYNVVRNQRDDFDPMPALLESVFDGEVEASDPRVVELLRTDAESARRFRETQRVVDRLQRRPITPDLSESILAVVHAKQPYAPKRVRSRVTPQRVAFACGLLAGIALVVVLQNVATAPRGGVSVDVAKVMEQGGAELAVDVLAPMESAPSASRTRAPLAFHDSTKHEAHFESSSSPALLAGASGGVDVTGRVVPATSIFASTAYASGSSAVASAISDQCIDEGPVGPSLLASVTRPLDQPLVKLTPAAYAPGKEWPPSDINAFIEHIEVCGVGDDLKISQRVN